MINLVSGLLWHPKAIATVEHTDTGDTAPPENGVVKVLRSAIPAIAAFDYLIITDIAIRLVLTLFIPATASQDKNGPLLWIFQIVPTGGVIITAVIGISLITARLASLESDSSDIATIKDAEGKKDRTTFLREQIKICKAQRSQSLIFMLAYVVLVAAPVTFAWETGVGMGRGIFLILIVGEMLIPLLNMRSFTIVEASLNKLDVIRDSMYQSQRAALSQLKGITKRALNGGMTRQDLASIRHGTRGNLIGMMQQHEITNVILLDGKTYKSLRSLLTGVRDGDALTIDQQKRYERALTVARRIRTTDDAEVKQHFTRGDHNQLFVTLDMSGQIANHLSHARTRASRKTQMLTTVVDSKNEGTAGQLNEKTDTLGGFALA